MPAPQVHQLLTSPIVAFSFNADRSKVAISPNTKDVDIYAKKGPEFQKADSLTDHDKLVTSVDWAPQSNRLVTCSQDVSALPHSSMQDSNVIAQRVCLGSTKGCNLEAYAGVVETE